MIHVRRQINDTKHPSDQEYLVPEASRVRLVPGRAPSAGPLAVNWQTTPYQNLVLDQSADLPVGNLLLANFQKPVTAGLVHNLVFYWIENRISSVILNQKYITMNICPMSI